MLKIINNKHFRKWKWL